MKKLEENVRLFCGMTPKADLAEFVSRALQSDRIVIVYDPNSEIYAEVASWPLIMFGFNVTVVDAHDALYYYAPYASETTTYVYFTDDIEGQLGVQLESALRIMNYNRVFLSSKETSGDEVFSFSYSDSNKSILYGLKCVAYGFTEALYRRNKNMRLARILENLRVEQNELFEYIMNSVSYTDVGQAAVIASQGPLLTIAKVAALLNPKILTVPTMRLLSGANIIQSVEIWGLDIDSELVARVRFEKGSPKSIVHFGFDPLSSVLASPYAVAYAEDFEINKPFDNNVK